jgi:2-amino-4-hydroxy-6-hydroxymethyldihydropteridine diphosphokinase
MSQTDCLIAFGANLGEPLRTLESAAAALDDRGFTVTAISRPVRTIAVGGPSNQPDYVNAAIRALTALSAIRAVETLLDVELSLGRKRSERWQARTVDLDLLLCGGQTLNLPNLVLPHPRMAWRRFMLQPAAEIAGEMVHPGCGLTINQLLARLDQLPRRIIWLMPKSAESGSELLDGELSQFARLERADDVASDATCRTLEKNSNKSSWSICVVTSAAQADPVARRSPLLVWNSTQWSNNDAETSFATSYPGAVLDLANAQGSPADEIKIAIRSME